MVYARIVDAFNLELLFILLFCAVEELTCLATWRDGNSRYLVGLVSHHHAVSNEERYRCFVYEKILSNGKLIDDGKCVIQRKR